MKTFNAFQAVLLFAGWPFVISWLSRGPFPYSPAAMWLCVVAYLVGFVGMVYAVLESMD